MNKKDFKAKMIIVDVKTLGDRLHNKDIEAFLDGVPVTALSKKVFDYIYSPYDEYNHRWIFPIFTKGMLRILRSLCRAKSKATIEKRKKMFIEHLLKGRYGAFVNRSLILAFCKTVGFDLETLHYDVGF